MGRHQRVSGTAREDLRTDMRALYEDGLSVRQLAQQYDRSYGLAHTLLREAGTSMRGRGGFQGSHKRIQSN